MQHWLSISSHKLGFLGVIIVEANDEKEALVKAMDIAPNELANACNIKGVVTEGYDDKWLNRLITKPEVYEIGESTRGTIN
jgi:hypothetical protein